MMKKVLILIVSIVASLSLVSTAFAAVYVSATANVTTPYKVSSTTTGTGQYALFECSIKNRNTTTTDSNITSWGECTLEKLSGGQWVNVKTSYVDETGNPGSTTSLVASVNLLNGVQYRVTSWLDNTQFDKNGNLYAAITTVS
jgi:cell wall-associated NlpC family hydrolase